MLPVAKVAAAFAAVVVPATGCREWRVGGATEEELFGDWVHCRDQDQQRSRALVGMAEDRADLLLQEGDLADHQPPARTPRQVPGRGAQGPRGSGPTELERPEGEPAHGPDQRQRQGRGIEPCAARLDPERDAHHDRADDDRRHCSDGQMQVYQVWMLAVWQRPPGRRLVRVLGRHPGDTGSLPSQ
jgi:hypothetical protein